MSDSILTSIKKLIGIEESYTFFDDIVLMHINTVFMILNQLGVGPAIPFSIEDATATWSDFLGDAANLAGVKTYIAAKVKLAFDPPQSSAVIEALKQNIAELEWRLNAAVDPANTFTADEDEANVFALENRAKIEAFRRVAGQIG